MAHIRTDIRYAIKDALTGLPTTGSNVFTSRARSLDVDQLPALRISAPREASGVAAVGSRNPLLARKVEIDIEGVVMHKDEFEDICDQIALEVEEVLGRNRTLGGLVKKVEPKAYELLVSDELEKTVAVGRMTFLVEYFTAQGVPNQHM